MNRYQHKNKQLNGKLPSIEPQHVETRSICIAVVRNEQRTNGANDTID